VTIDDAVSQPLMSGEECPCPSRDPDYQYTRRVAALSVSSLWLENDQRFTGYTAMQPR